MINIYVKSKEEIAKQDRNYAMGATLAGSRAVKLTVCPTYLLKKDGTRVDTRDLTEQEILLLIANDLQDFTNPQGRYTKSQKAIGALDAFKLSKALGENYRPSYNVLIQLLQMEAVYGHIVMDLIGSLNGGDTISKAKAIASFNKETANDFGEVDNYDLIAVIQQMQINAMNRQQARHKK